MKRILLILIPLSLLFLFTQTASAASLSLSSTSFSLKAGTPFWLEVYLDNQNQATLGTDVVLNFDPQFLEAEEIEEGKIYPSYPGKKIDNDQGKIYLSGVTTYGSPVDETGILARIKFLPKKGGETQIGVEWKSGRTDLTSVVPYSGQENLLNQAPAPVNFSIAKQSLIERIFAFLRRILQTFTP